MQGRLAQRSAARHGTAAAAGEQRKGDWGIGIHSATKQPKICTSEPPAPVVRGKNELWLPDVCVCVRVVVVVVLVGGWESTARLACMDMPPGMWLMQMQLAASKGFAGGNRCDT